MNKKLLRRRSRDDDSGRHFSQCSSSNKFRATGFLIGLGIAVVLSQGAVVLTGDTSLPARAIQLKQLNMTTLIFNLSSWTNDGLSVLGEPNANTTGMTELATTSGKKETTVVDLPRKNRSIVMVHVGKCGGSTMRLSTGISCYGGTTKKYNVTVNGPPQEKCIRQRFNATQALARQTRFVFHMWDYNEEIAANATTFLVTLRNPVDRLISNYRYSHPANCVPTERKGLRPYGCHILNDPLYNNTQSNRYKTWRVCFPDPGIEEFAQSVMSPYPETLFQNNTLVQQQQLQWPCRKRARDMFLGKWAVNRGYPAPHMFYNYQHYSNKTVNKFPDKEVVAVRTSHEWEDMVALDKSLGGAGVFPHKGRHVSHGSETYAPSPVSSEAYQKMCCILHDEIREYLRLLTLAINFDDATKQETEEALRRKCAIDDIPWHDWHSECQKKIDDDDDILLRSTDYQ